MQFNRLGNNCKKQSKNHTNKRKNTIDEDKPRLSETEIAKTLNKK